MRKAFLDNFKIVVVLEFIINVYAFSLIIELIIVPLGAIMVAMSVYAEYVERYSSVAKLANGLMAIFGITLISFTAYMIAKDSGNFFQPGILTDFALPIVLSILFLPFMFILVTYTRYENAFMRIRFMYNQLRLRRRAMLIALRRFHVRTVLLKRWIHYIQSNRPQDTESLEASIAIVKNATSFEKVPPAVDPSLGWSPYLACKFLEGVGVVAHNYRPDASDQAQWFAYSSYVEIEGGSISDYIIYYVEGDECVADALKLVVNIGDVGTSHYERDRFAEATKVLFWKALCRDMPSAMSKAIKEETPERLEVGNMIADFSKENRHGHNAYELTFSLRIKGGG